MEDRQAVLQARRQADEAQGHQPHRGLPRHPAGRAVDHRHPGRQEVVRAARAGRAQGAEHQLLPLAGAGRAGLRRRRRGLRPVGRQPDRPSPSRWRARTRSRPSSSSRCRTPAAASPRRPATSSACARSATSTTCCWCPTRSSAPSAGSAPCSAATSTATCPDMITCAKGLTSGYSPIGACIVSDRIAAPFWTGTTSFPHGYTFGGHPVSAAVGHGQPRHLRARGPEPARAAERGRLPLDARRSLPTCRSSATSAATATSTASSSSRTRSTKETFDDDESERLLRGFLSRALFENGLYCRADDRGDPVIQLAPPLIVGQAEFDEIEQVLRSVLTEAWSRL